MIDVGTNKVTDDAEAEALLRNFPERLEKFRMKGNALIGDVHPDAVNVAGALSPVPGGVGPMTITMLMSNTVKAARLRRGSTPRWRVGKKYCGLQEGGEGPGVIARAL